MKFIVSSTQLLKKLQIIGGVIGTNNTMPILDNFLFELSENELIIVASDLETTIRGSVNVESDTTGSIAVPAKLLIDTLKNIPEQPLTFLAKENHTIDIISNSGRYSLAYMKPDEFPSVIEISDAEKINIQGDVLSVGIQKTIFATANSNDGSSAIGGVYFSFSPEKFVLVGTDGRRLAIYERADITSEAEANFVMPKKPLNLLKNNLSESDVVIEYNEQNAKFTFDGFEFICRLIDGKYPNYEIVIPKDNPNTLSVDRAQFYASIRRVSVLSNQSTHQINLKVSGNSLQISAEDVEFSNSANEILPCTYEGDDIEIGFNWKFLMEMLNNLSSEQVVIKMSVPNRPGLLHPIDGLDEGENVTMLLMPMKIGTED